MCAQEEDDDDCGRSCFGCLKGPMEARRQAARLKTSVGRVARQRARECLYTWLSVMRASLPPCRVCVCVYEVWGERRLHCSCVKRESHVQPLLVIMCGERLEWSRVLPLVPVRSDGRVNTCVCVPLILMSKRKIYAIYKSHARQHDTRVRRTGEKKRGARPGGPFSVRLVR